MRPIRKIWERAFLSTGVIVLLFGFTDRSSGDSAVDASAIASAAVNSASTTLSFSYSPNPLIVGSTATLAATGGTAPYTYSLYSGYGSISGSTYFATAAGTTTIVVSDSNGVAQYFSLIVYTAAHFASSYTLQTVHRFFSVTAKHLFTLSTDEGVAAGLTYEGGAFSVFTTSQANTIALYRCYIPSVASHFVSTASNCGGYTVESVYGYVYNYQAAGSLPLYSFYSSNYHYLVTTSYGEGIGAGMTYSGIIGYVPTY